MNITINVKSGKSLNVYAVDYAAAKAIKFSKKYKGLINSVVDRLGNRI